MTTAMSPSQTQFPSLPNQGGRPVPRFTWVALLALLIAVAALGGINRDIIGLFHDDAIYIAVAKSLSEGEGYRIASLPSSPAQTKYPFLYSYLLSWIWQLNPTFPDNILLLKTLNVILLVAIFIFSYLFYCRNTENADSKALLYALLVCTNRTVFSLTDLTLSDLLFMLLSLLALWLCHGAGPGSKLGIAALSSIIGLAFLTKTAAAPLALAGAVFLASKRRYLDMSLYGVLLLVFSMPWLLWVAQEASPQSNALFSYYLSHDFRLSDPGQIAELVTANLVYLYGSLDLLFLTSKIPGLDILICLVAALGLCDSLRRHNSFFWVFVGSYFALVLVWPFHPWRYTLPLIPVVMLFLFRGIDRLRKLVRQIFHEAGSVQMDRVLAKAFLLLLLVLNLAWLSNYLILNDEHHTRGFFGWRFPYRWSGFLETFDWVRRNTDKGDILATGYDPMYYHYTGRKAVRPGFHRPETYFYPYGQAAPNVGTAQEIKKQLDLLGVRYLIIDPLDGYVEGDAQTKIFRDLLDVYSTPPELVFTSSDIKHKVYKLPAPVIE
jgi:hypothetical protein